MAKIVKKNVAHSILENVRKSKELCKYIKEDFFGYTTLGKLFKKYEQTFLATIDAAINRNISKLSDVVKDKIGSGKLLSLSFDEKDDGDFIINIGFDKNGLLTEDNSVTFEVTICEENLKLVGNIADSNYSKLTDITKLLSSYTGKECPLTEFEEFIEMLTRLFGDVVFLHIRYLESIATQQALATSYDVNMIKNFLDYLVDEINREIFSNPVYDAFVETDVEYETNTVSLTAYSPDKLDYLMFDYVYSPELNKFEQIGITTSKTVKVNKFKNLFTENLLDFIQSLKEDLASLYEGITVEDIEPEEVEVKTESNILYNLKDISATGIICIEMNGTCYQYIVKDKTKNIEDVRKELIDVISKKPEDVLSYIQNNLEITSDLVIEKSEELKTEDKKEDEKDADKKDEKSDDKDKADEKKDEKDKEEKKESVEVKTEDKKDDEDKKETDDKDEKDKEDKEKEVKKEETKNDPEEKKDDDKKDKEDDKEKKDEKDEKKESVINKIKDEVKLESLNVKKEDSEYMGDDLVVSPVAEHNPNGVDPAMEDATATTPANTDAFTHDDVGEVKPMKALDVKSTEIKENDDEIMYYSNDKNEAEGLIECVGKVDEGFEARVENVIKYLTKKYNENNQDHYFTSDYVNDLQVTKEDKIFQNDAGYKIIFNENNKTFALLRPSKIVTESLINRADSQDKEDFADTDTRMMWYLTKHGNPSFKGPSVNSTKMESFKIELKDYLRTEGWDCSVNDIIIVENETYNKYTESKKEFDTVIEDTTTKKKYLVSIVGDGVFVTEKK